MIHEPYDIRDAAGFLFDQLRGNPWFVGVAIGDGVLIVYALPRKKVAVPETCQGFSVEVKRTSKIIPA